MMVELNGGAPRLTRVGLRRGTAYQVLTGDALSTRRVLERDVDVLVGDLGEVFNVYETDDGETIFVRVEDEIHDGTEDADD